MTDVMPALAVKHQRKHYRIKTRSEIDKHKLNFIFIAAIVLATLFCSVEYLLPVYGIILATWFTTKCLRK